MEGTSVLSPPSWEKRRAWVRQSRCWRTTVAEEEAAAATRDTPELQPPHLDDVFLEGSPSSKIETWLQECHRWKSHQRSQDSQAPPGLCSLPGCGSSGTSFEDDLTLGAEALLLLGSDKAMGRAPRGKPLTLGHSMASSALSSLTTKSSSSISEVLEWRQADAEEILYNLGFVQSEAGAASRVPPRFFAAPSRARGIDFQLFLKAQVRRMEMEDPCLMLASRFQQVQALAATADAFFCLYSYVSRTPVQRISPSHLPWAHPHVPDTLVAPPQPSPLSPVDRLRKAVSTMCLYTSPRDGDSPRATGRVASGQPSALGRVVQEVLERVRGERFRFDPADVTEGWDAGTAWGPPSPVSPLGAAQGCLERSCPHGWGSGDTPMGVAPGAGGAPCPVGAGWVGVEEPDTTGNVTSSPTPGPHAIRGWVTPEHPGGLGCEGDSGFGSGSWGTSPRRSCGDPLDPAGPRCPVSDTPRAGGHRVRRSRGRCQGGPLRDAGPQQGDVWGLHPPGKHPSPHHPGWQEPVDSFEMEEVPSASEEEEEEEEEDTHEAAGRSLHPSAGIRRSFLLHASSGRSDSSGFVEETVPGHPPAAHGAGQEA